MSKTNEIIRRYRETIGMTQAELSSKTGISIDKISRIEIGRTRLTVEDYKNIIIKGFGIEPNFFTDTVLETKIKERSTNGQPKKIHERKL